MRRRVGRAAAFGLLACALTFPARGEAPRIGPDSGLPVPRYVSLKSERANARRGPGAEHRIDWIYQRPGLPLLVTAESGPWRRVRDPDGATSWIHSGQLENRRTAYVRGGRLGSAALRREPDADARVLVYLGRGVVARLEACRGRWRLISVGGRSGWTDADALWGVESCADSASSE
jgi:SH3-like domain-containing protein